VISLIVAASANNVIGNDGELPWRLSDDLKRFKAVTMGKPIVMGRKTFESIGRPLPGRLNIVITRQNDFAADGCEVVQSIEKAVEVAGAVEEVMVIGGSQIYAAFLQMADRVYLTRVHTDVEGDALFPSLDHAEWRESSREEHEADELNEYACTVTTFERLAQGK
jgi:dihydrofolate reductase